MGEIAAHRAAFLHVEDDFAAQIDSAKGRSPLLGARDRPLGLHFTENVVEVHAAFRRSLPSS